MSEAVSPRIRISGDAISMGDLKMTVASITIRGSLDTIPTYQVNALPTELQTNLIHPEVLLDYVAQWSILVNSIETTATLTAVVREESVGGADEYQINLKDLILKNVAPEYSIEGQLSHIALEFSHPIAGADHGGYSIGMASVRRVPTNAPIIRSSAHVLAVVLNTIKEALVVAAEVNAAATITNLAEFQSFVTTEGRRALDVLTRNVVWYRGEGSGFPLTNLESNIVQTLLGYLPELIAEEVINANSTPFQALLAIMHSYGLVFSYTPWETDPLTLIPANPWKKSAATIQLQDGYRLSSSYVSNPVIGMYNMTKLPTDPVNIGENLTAGASVSDNRLVGGVTKITTDGYYGGVIASHVPHWVGLYVQRKTALNKFDSSGTTSLQRGPKDNLDSDAIATREAFEEQTTLTNHYMVEDFTTVYQAAAIQLIGTATPKLLKALTIGATPTITRDGEPLYKGYLSSMELTLSPQSKTASLTVILTHTSTSTGVSAIGITPEHFTDGRKELLYLSNEITGV